MKKSVIGLLIATGVIGAVGVSGLIYLNSTPTVDVLPAEQVILTPNEFNNTDQTVLFNFVDISQLDNQAELYRQANLLRQTGSLTGGELTTQFKRATHAKMSYRFGRKKPTTFKPVVLTTTLPSGFVLTGREYQGVLLDKKYTGMYRLFENPNTKARLEISEQQILANQPITLVRELFNEKIGDVPVRLESFQDKKGVIYYSAEFAHQDKYYTISSKGMEKFTVLALLEQLLSQ